MTEVNNTPIPQAAVYRDSPTKNADQLVQEYALLVKRIAHHLTARMPSSVQADDLLQSGMIGLLEAAQKYDAGKGASFETYAGIRIRGAMLDEIRKGDWVPRSVHRNARSVSAAIKSIEMRTGRDAKDKEIANELGIELQSYFSILQDAVGGRLFSYDEVLKSDDTAGESFASGPLDQLQQGNFRMCLAKAIEGLPDREQLVLSLYYDDELNLKEIGAVLGVSESRVSQIHSQAALRLRARLSEWWEE